MNIFELTRQLIDLESITGHEREVGLFVRDILEKDGFEVTAQPIDETKFNLFATLGTPTVVLSTHLDTVPPFFSSSETDEYIFGRGACDTKGIIASMIFAARELKSSGIKDLGLLFVTGEESGSDGARLANSNAPASVKYLINGEPTENKLALGSKGALRLEVTTTGKRGHSAYPHVGESAIEKLLDILNDVRALALPEHPILGKTTCNIGTISGGIQANVIPDSGRTELMLRTVTDTGAVRDLIAKTVGARGTVKTNFECEPLLLEAVPGFETGVMAFTTDIPLLDNWGKPFLLGPGSILDAHTEAEKISKRELTESVDLYVSLTKKLLVEKN
ncbi:MAG TPA: M20/M25/M40 family metallo-hydrolase [Blastocatellia bacterium]|nr:M20/M25/M40 family metallo-hydrolase [Blastocatellia bacterium]